LSKKKSAKLFKNWRNNYDFIDTAMVNDLTYFDYLNRFKQIALSMFEWVNLPSSMNADFLEKCLYYFGQASLLKTIGTGFINTKCCSNGNINIYGIPTSLNCFSYEFHEDRTVYCGLTPATNEYNSCILVKNNWEKLPTAGTMELFAMRLYEAERTCDVNIKAQKTPYILVGDESFKLTLKNLWNKIIGNEPVIFGDKKQLSSDVVRSIKTDAPFIADKVMDYKKQIWNEALTYLGINNIMLEKKERLVSDEANSNNELINMNLQARLAPRKEACKQFNELFGTNIDVRVRSDLHNIIKTLDSSVVDLQNNQKEIEVVENE